MSAMTIELPPKLKTQMTSMARRLGIGHDRFVCEAVAARLQNGSATTAPSLYDLSRDLCGSVAGRPSHLPRNKKHLKGYGAWKRRG